MVLQFTAEILGVKERLLTLVAGHKSRDKVVQVDADASCLDETTIMARFAAYMDSPSK
jgi:uncharacterized protein YggU (UPF0235/DUF167 family)